jgi:NADPH:quinone reductase-like Zn-dependent oxidoreductase
MKAAIRHSLVGFNLGFSNDHKEPTLSKNSNNLLIEVKAAAINPVDYKLPRMAAGDVIGIDVCGEVIEVGHHVDPSFVKVGELVFGSSSSGSLAEKCLVKADHVAKVPPKWKATEAAALPVSYVSSLQGLRTGGITPAESEALQPKQSVLIIGASGGCGLASLQLAKAMKVPRIVGICSGNNEQLAKDYGATEVVDYTDEAKLNKFFDSEVGNFDCVFDVATGSGGGELYTDKSRPLLRSKTGEYVALNGPASKWMRKMIGFEKEHEHILMCDRTTDDLDLVMQLLDSINARPFVHVKPFTEENVKEGFNQLKSRRTKGKIVFEM